MEVGWHEYLLTCIAIRILGTTVKCSARLVRHKDLVNGPSSAFHACRVCATNKTNINILGYCFPQYFGKKCDVNQTK